MFNPTVETYMVKFTPPSVVGDTKISFNTSFDKFQVEDVELEDNKGCLRNFKKTRCKRNERHNKYSGAHSCF